MIMNHTSIGVAAAIAGITVALIGGINLIPIPAAHALGLNTSTGPAQAFNSADQSQQPNPGGVMGLGSSTNPTAGANPRNNFGPHVPTQLIGTQDNNGGLQQQAPLMGPLAGNPTGSLNTGPPQPSFGQITGLLSDFLPGTR
jgi:hypothetical protein